MGPENAASAAAALALESMSTRLDCVDGAEGACAPLGWLSCSPPGARFAAGLRSGFQARVGKILPSLRSSRLQQAYLS